jgi:hypothetical protein
MKIKLVYYFLFFVFLVSSKIVLAQGSSGQNQVYMNGQLVKETDHSGIEGSPFFNDDWATGLVTLADGRTFKDMSLKYNVYTDEVYFKDQGGETRAFSNPVSEFKIISTENGNSGSKDFKSGYTIIPGYTAKSFFQVLSEGTVQLLKKYRRVVSETTGIDLGTVTKKFTDKESYYMIISGTATLVKKDKKAILTLLNNKQTELEAYIKAHKLDLKNDDDLANLVNYYNSI